MPLNSDFGLCLIPEVLTILHKLDPGGNPLHENETKKFDAVWEQPTPKYIQIRTN